MNTPTFLLTLAALALVGLPLWWLLRAQRLALATAVTASALASAPSARRHAALQAQWAQLDADARAGQIDTAELNRTRDELMRRLLEEDAAAHGSPRLAAAPSARPWVLMLGLPLLVWGVYSATGSPQAVNWRSDEAPMRSAEMRDVTTMIDAMAQALRAKAPGAPDEDARAWAMVGQSYASLQRFAEAEQAFAQASERAPDNPQWLADRADALAMANGQRIDGEPERLIARALQLDPKHLKALALAGSAAYNRQDMAGALAHWRRAREQAPEGSGFATEMDRSIAAAQAALRQRAP